MFYIHNSLDSKRGMSQEEHLQFIKSCEHYLMKLKSENKLIAAQPLMSEGIILTYHEQNWKVEIPDTSSIHVGYYHIRAQDIDEAISIAKGNPEFCFVPSASIEIHEIKTKESATWFIYPTSQSV